MNARKLANIITALLEGEQGFVERVKDSVEEDSFKEVHILMEGKWFSVCVKEMDAEDRSGEQRTLKDNGTYYYSGVILRLGDPPTAWVEKGGRAVPLSSMELAILTDQANRDLVGIRDERHAAELVLKLIWLQDHLGMFRCTGCSNLFHKPIALRPLFTGALCKGCAERYQEDVRTGKIIPPSTAGD